VTRSRVIWWGLFLLADIVLWAAIFGAAYLILWWTT
jgi:hypothetical protein